jgi:Fe-S cluster assembly protein SufD
MDNMERTITASSYKEKLVDNFKVFELNLQEDDDHPVYNLREEALARFDEMGFPSRKHEEWKYTKIGKYLKNDYQPRTHYKLSDVDDSVLQQAEIPGLRSNKLVFVNGFFDPNHSEIIEKDKFEFVNIAEALAGGHELLLKGMKNVKDREEDPFIWLNQAFLRDGALIRVKDNTTLEHPIYFVNIEVPAGGNHFDNVRHIVEVGNHKIGAAELVVQHDGAEEDAGDPADDE